MAKFYRKDVRKRLASIYSINEGGCLVATYVMYLNELRNGKGGDFQVVQLSNDDDGMLEHNLAFLEGEESWAESDSHFGWTFNGGKTVYDSKGRVNLNRYLDSLLIPKEKTKEFCLSALNESTWNPEFEREYHVPKIGEDLELDLSEISLDNYYL